MIDEQLAGHVEGLDILRGAIGGMEKGYSRFQNVPEAHRRPGRRGGRRLAHLGRQRGRRADRGGGRRTTSSSGTARSPTWRTSTTRGRSIPSSTRSWTEDEHGRTTTSSSSAPARPARASRAASARSPTSPCSRSRRAASRIPRTSRTRRSGTRSSAPTIDWGYLSVPQQALGGRPTYEPRGKMPGGSSNLYIMMHIRGHASDYDNWAYNGCPGWSYDGVPRRTSRSSRTRRTTPTRPAGKGGPIHVSNASLHDPNPTSQAFLDACAELGFPSTDDFNGPNMEGAGWHHINVKDGKRYSHARRATSTRSRYRENLTLSHELAGDAAAPRGRPLRRRRVRARTASGQRRARRAR